MAKSNFGTKGVPLEELLKQKVLNEEAFFKDVQAECNYLPIETVKAVYFAVLRQVARDLRRKSVAMIPRFGYIFYLEFSEAYLNKMKDMRAKSGRAGNNPTAITTHQLKFAFGQSFLHYSRGVLKNWDHEGPPADVLRRYNLQRKTMQHLTEKRRVPLDDF